MGLEAMRQAIRLLRAHKVRSLLTMFGLVWGTASVIFLVGWGAGVTEMIEDGMFRSGKNMGEVWAGRVSEEFTPAVDRRWLWFENDHLEVLRRRIKVADRVGGEYWQLLPATFQQRVVSADIRGLDPEAFAIRGVSIAQGRALTPSDVEHQRRIAIVGHRIQQRLLGPEGHVGSWIRLDGKRFRVVGILEKVGTQLSRDRMELDDHIWIPISTAQAYWPAWWTEEKVVSKIVFQVDDHRDFDAAEKEVRAILADQIDVGREDEEAVMVWSSLKLLRNLPLEQTAGMMFVLAAATLVIGGIGVLNMMLDSVHERRQEIGMRLAIGARRRDILAQFFVETFTISGIGGGVGAILGVAACALLGRVDAPDMIPVPILSWTVVALAVSVMLAVGLAAGLVPAWRAARVDPADTLRME